MCVCFGPGEGGQHCSCQSDPTSLQREEGQASEQSSTSGRGDLEDVPVVQELRRRSWEIKETFRLRTCNDAT